MKTPNLIQRAGREVGRKQQIYKLSLDDWLNGGHLVLGSPGAGKTRWIVNQLMQAIRLNVGTTLVDVQGDLFLHVLAYLAGLCTRMPGLAQRVIIIDPLHDIGSEDSISINPLTLLPEETPSQKANQMVDFATRIFDLDHTKSPRLVYLLKRCFESLVELGMDLPDLPRFVYEKEYRNSLLPQIKSEAVRRFWEVEFPKSREGQQQMLGPMSNKLNLFEDPFIKPLLSGDATINGPTILDNSLIVLVNLNQGKLGAFNGSLIGSLLTEQIFQAGMARGGSAHITHPAHMLIADEFPAVCMTSARTIDLLLSQARKYRLGIVAGMQYLDALSPDLQNALLKTSKSIAAFNISYGCARVISPYIYPYSNFLEHLGITGWDGLAQVLSNQPKRGCTYRYQWQPEPHMLSSFQFSDPDWSPRLELAMMELRELSKKLHSSSIVEVKEQPVQVIESSNPAPRQSSTSKKSPKPKSDQENMQRKKKSKNRPSKKKRDREAKRRRAEELAQADKNCKNGDCDQKTNKQQSSDHISERQDDDKSEFSR